MRGGPWSIRRRIGSARSMSSPHGIRSSHHVTPRSASGPARSRPAGPAGLAPPMTMSNGRSARPFSARQPRRNSTSSRTWLRSGRPPPARPARAGVAPAPPPPRPPPNRRLVRPDPADPDRHPRPLHRDREENHVVDRDLAAAVGDRLTGPQQVQRVQALIQPLGEHLGVGRVAEAAVLARDGLTEPDTEDHAAAGQPAPRGHLPGQLGRPPPGHRRDRGAQPDPAGPPGGGSGPRPRGPPPPTPA